MKQHLQPFDSLFAAIEKPLTFLQEILLERLRPG
jgi:hypothetical protein